MDLKIQSFLEAENNFSFCTTVNNVPHCVSCFYAFMAENNLLLFKSDRNSKHITNAFINDQVAGTILPDLKKTGTIKGIQFAGRFLILKNEILEIAKKKYYLKFPFALVIPGELWTIELRSVKMIDNTLGFGKKLYWEKTFSDEIIA